MQNEVTLKEHIKMLVARYGSLHEVGKATETDYTYLSRLLRGGKSNPGDEVLRKLGLRKIVTYYVDENCDR